MIRVILIDDEENARITLRELLALNCPEVKIEAEAEGVNSAASKIELVQPDAVFLDIKLNESTGFDLLARFPNPQFHVIFTTAYNQFALKAFKYNAIDYLTKPIDPDELIAAVCKIKKARPVPEKIDSLMNGIRTKQFNQIALSTNEELIFLKLEKIIRLESNSNYTTFYTQDNEKVMVARTLKEFEDILPGGQFSRIHQSHIVNLDHIKKVIKEDGGYALTTDNVKLPISRRKKDVFLEALMKRSIL